jgi:uncharacterized membrane protein YfcA
MQGRAGDARGRAESRSGGHFSMMLGLVVLGLAIGTISGMVGVGGGIFLVPALHYLFRFSQHEAQGTSIAVLVPPIGIFAALEYYRHGYVRLPVVAGIACGFAVGALVGAVLANQVDQGILRRMFATFMLFVALQMLFSASELRMRTVLPTAAATGVAAILAWIDRRFGVGRRLRARLVRWIHRRRPPRHLDGNVEYHI